MRLRLGALGHTVSAWPSEELETEIMQVDSQPCLCAGGPSKDSGQQGSGELPWLLILSAYCHTSMPGK